jgi:hypothetical protein
MHVVLRLCNAASFVTMVMKFGHSPLVEKMFCWQIEQVKLIDAPLLRYSRYYLSGQRDSTAGGSGLFRSSVRAYLGNGGFKWMEED